MRGLMNVVFLLGIAFLSAVIVYMNYFSKAQVKEKIGLGVFRDVIDVVRSETISRAPLDSERSRALEKAIYFVGSFGGWYNPNISIPNFTNPFVGIFPETRIFCWRDKDNLYVPSFENLSASLSSFYSGYFSYETLRKIYPKDWFEVYKRMYPIRPEMVVFYEKVELGRENPETRIYLMGSPLTLSTSIGISKGEVMFYPMITARSKAPIYRLYQFAKKTVSEGTLKNISSGLEEFFYWNSLVDIKIPTVSYVENGEAYLLPKYDPITYTIVVLGEYLNSKGVPGFPDDENWSDPLGWLVKKGCYNETAGGRVYYCLDYVKGKVNDQEATFYRNASCNVNACFEKFWRILDYYYYQGLKEVGKNINDSANNVYLRIIPVRYSGKVEVYEDLH